MRKTITHVLATGAAVALVAGFGATAAAADQDFTVTNPHPNDEFVAHADDVDLTNQDTGVSFTCESTAAENASNADGFIDSNGYTTPAAAGSVENLDFNNCSGPIGAVTAEPEELPYDIVVTEVDDPVAGDAEGYIADVSVDVDMLGCEFTVVGNAPGYWDNAAQQLVMTPDVALPDGVAPLEPIDISNCLGLVNPDDELTYEGEYMVTDPEDPIIIEPTS